MKLKCTLKAKMIPTEALYLRYKIACSTKQFAWTKLLGQIEKDLFLPVYQTDSNKRANVGKKALSFSGTDGDKIS